MIRAFTSAARSSLPILAALVLLLPSSQVWAQAKAKPQDDADDFSKKKRRSGSFKKLKLRQKKRSKLKFKFKRKKTKRELAEEAAKKAAAEAKKKKPKVKASGISAAKAMDEQKAKLILQSINSLKEVIPQMPEDSKEDKKRKAEMMFRLAEEYWEYSSHLRFGEMDEHNKAMEKWDAGCRDKPDASKCKKPPKPNLEKSEAYRAQAVSVYKRVVKLFPNYPRADQVMFILGLNLMETKKYKQGLKLFQDLIKKFPKSRFVPDSYVTMANYHFGQNKVNPSIENFKKAKAIAVKRINTKGTSEDQKVSLRGIELRSIYMLGWCDFNVGDYEKTLAAFQKVIKLSIRYEKSKESRVLLKNEALRDLVRVYAKTGADKEAYEYFKKVMGPKYAYIATKKLASRYYSEGNYNQAIKTYRLLLTLNPQGQRDTRGPEAPTFQNEIVRSAARIWEPDKIYAEVLKLTRFFESKSPWSSKWRSNKKIYDEARERAEQTILEYSTKYHKRAQNEKKVVKREKYYDFAAQLYEQYMRYFYDTESAYELRFFFAEVLYHKAQYFEKKRRVPKTGCARKGSTKMINNKACKYYARAARQYYLVAKKNPRGQYLRQAAFAELLSLEALAGRKGNADVRGGKIKGLRVDKKTGKVTWDRGTIRYFDKKLLSAYDRYLKIVKKKDERLLSFFKMGSIYYSYRHYLKSMDIFRMMAKEFPQHELSRRAAFMILYSYEDLREWAKLEDSARLFIKDPKLTKNRKFYKEMYSMLYRSTYLHIRKIKEKAMKETAPVKLANELIAYEKEFGPRGPWVPKKVDGKKFFAESPRAANALAWAGFYLSKGKKVLRAIETKQQLIRYYPKHKLAKRITYEVAQEYEQIADYENSARWYERYVFDNQDPMKLAQLAAAAEEAKKKKKKRRRRRRRRRRSKKKKKSKNEPTAKELAKIKANKKNGLYKAAAYRRSLGQFDRALVLYREYIKRFDKSKDIPTIHIAIAKDIFEDNKKYDKAIAEYKLYLSKYQSDKIGSYLKRAQKLFEKNLATKGELWVLKKLKPMGKKIPNDDLKDEFLLFCHARIAGVMRKQGKGKEMGQRFMRVSALGQLMIERKVPLIMKPTPSRASLAESRFFLSERRRDAFRQIQFVGRSRKDKRIFKEIIKVGTELANDYARVAKLGIPKWTLAAVYRRGEIYQLFTEKLRKAPMPSDLPKSLHPQYKMILENKAFEFEDQAIEAYDSVLKTSAALGLYNEWVKKCEDSRNELKRQKGRINPLTLVSKRKASFFKVTPNMQKMKLKAPAPAVAPAPRRAAPAKPTKTTTTKKPVKVSGVSPKQP